MVLFVPAALIAGSVAFNFAGVAGSQSVIVDTFSDIGEEATLRTNVSPECQASMIELHGQEAWDAAIQQQVDIDAAGGVQESVKLSEEEIQVLLDEKVKSAPPSDPVF
jgi:hypothetical protein